MLNVVNVTKCYGKVLAVKGLSFELKRGELLGLLGPNGAGKSTTISMLSTLAKPTEGTITFEGKDIAKHPDDIRHKLGLVPQEIALYEALSGLDNLRFWGSAYGLKGDILKARIEQVSLLVGLEERLKDTVASYSGGMKRRLNIGAALLHEPELLILDEPTVGIDPQSRKHILERIKDLNRAGMTIVYASHYMEEIAFLCNRVMIMDQGTVVAAGEVETLLQREGLDPQKDNLEALFFKLTGKDLRD